MLQRTSEVPQTNTSLVVAAISPDEIPLPVASAKSNLLERTRAQYNRMSQAEQGDFWRATSCTIGGVALTGAANVADTYNPNNRVSFPMRMFAYVGDYFDGYFAKRQATTASTGAATEFGGISDPLADKANNLMNEIALQKQGRLTKRDVMIRTGRDIAVTLVRYYVTKKSGGIISVKANNFGRGNTVLRDGGNLFGFTSVAGEHEQANRIVQNSVNAYTVASGAYTVVQLFRANRRSKS